MNRRAVIRLDSGGAHECERRAGVKRGRYGGVMLPLRCRCVVVVLPSCFRYVFAVAVLPGMSRSMLMTAATAENAVAA